MTLAGRIDARGLGYSQDRVHIQNATVSARPEPEPGPPHPARDARDRARREDHRPSGLGTLEGFPFRWKLRRSGSSRGRGHADAAAASLERVALRNAGSGCGGGRAPRRGAIRRPTIQGQITGQIDIHYDQRAGTVSFGESRIATPATSLNLSGTLGQNLDVRARSTNLDDLLPALAHVERQRAGDFAAQTRSAQAGRGGGRWLGERASRRSAVSRASDGHQCQRGGPRVRSLHCRRAGFRAVHRPAPFDAHARGQTQITGDAVVSRAMPAIFWMARSPRN